MVVFVTGCEGQLGHDVVCELIARGHIVIASDIYEESKTFASYKKLDITNKELVINTIISIHPDAIIHCAAWTNVDGAEDECNKELVYKINALGTENIALSANKVRAKVLYISTDYVFDGCGEEPWDPDCKSFHPLNFYGQTKLLGEKFVASICEKYFIVRIAWVFGRNGKNFVKTMVSLAEKGYKALKVVDDQIGTPTYTRHLAVLLSDMIISNKYGFYNATNEGGYISWADFAEEIFRQIGSNIKIKRVSTDEYGLSKAKRPLNSRLSKDKLKNSGFNCLPTWKEALSDYLRFLVK